MAYCLFRLFVSNRSGASPWQRLRAEMMPKLQAMPEFLRFAAIETTDGRYGGFSVYETKSARDRGA
ncbi:MAG: hypothetical protein JOY70_01055, partial [Acidisphaera sp.]|nr:hypothetical protein [Acidisphaera sp.]